MTAKRLGVSCFQYFGFCGSQILIHNSLPYANVLVRNTSFFNKLPANDLWRGVTAVSNAGKKRGRGKGSGKKLAKDLNRGQIIGMGSKNIIWPGLNSPVIRGNELIYHEKLPSNEDHLKNILKLRDSMGNFKLLKVNPIDRGWSGSKMTGRSIGSPDAVGDEKFELFDTRVLENKIVFIMKGNMGRKRRYSVLSVTGNGNGLAGFASAKATEVRTALRKSKNRAGQKLMGIKLYENRTVFHNFYTGFGKTKIFVSKQSEGSGLICHRAIQTICKVIGIKDLYAKIEGSENLQHIVKAFFIGLLQQKTHVEVANNTQLHVIEFRKEQANSPQVLASPNQHRSNKYVKHDKFASFSQYILGDHVMLKKNKLPPFYVDLKGYELYLRKREIIRNQNKVRLDISVNNNQVRKICTQKNSECNS